MNAPSTRGLFGVGTRDDDRFASLRRSAPPRAERYELGRSLRERAHRSDMAAWSPPPDRADPVRQIADAHTGRVPELVPVRVGRMVASPYAFLRGSANIMADDFAALPSTGITPVICGDAHLGNFGFYASPERELVFDLNDFDEAHPGAWEWDLRRLVTSVHVAGRQNGFKESACADAVEHCVEEYQLQIQHLAEQPLLARSFDQLDVERLRAAATKASFREGIERAARRARRTARSTSLRSPGLAPEPSWSTSSRSKERASSGCSARCPSCSWYSSTQCRTACSQALSRKPFCRPATCTLTVSRRRSHSQAPGCASSKSFRSKTSSRSGDA